MKWFITASLIVLIAVEALAQHGSFLILKSSYLFKSRSQQERVTLTRRKEAYNVIRFYEPKGASLMFEIAFGGIQTDINGSGFIVETESELKTLGASKVKVYPNVPSSRTNLTDYQAVPSNRLSFTGRQETSPDFPHLVWKAVNYKIQVPARLWVPEWAGIYRPDKEADWMNETYQAANRMDVTPELLNKILNGQVEAGFTKEQVRLALGSPLKEESAENDTRLEWIYYGRKVIFVDDIVSRVL